MSKLNRNQQGFSVVEGLLVLIVVLLIGFIGYYVSTQRTGSKADTTTAKEASAATTKTTTQTKAQPDNYVEAIHDDGSVTTESAASFAKTSDELGVLKAAHAKCTSSAAYVVVNEKVFTDTSDPLYVQDGGYARIDTSCGPKATTLDDLGGSGAATLLHRNSDMTWTIDAQSQAAVSCSAVDGKGYPTTVLAQCMDGDTARAPRS